MNFSQESKISVPLVSGGSERDTKRTVARRVRNSFSNEA